MTVADSNIVIHAASSAYPQLQSWMQTTRRAVSGVTRVETLGFHGLTPADEASLLAILGQLLVLPVDTAVENEAIRLRRRRRMKLGDSLIAATALVHRCDLATRNMRDFTGIPGLIAFDPS